MRPLFLGLAWALGVAGLSARVLPWKPSLRAHRFQEAAEHLDGFLAEHPEHIQALVDRVFVAVALSDEAEARRAAWRLLRLDRSSGLGRATLLWLAGRKRPGSELALGELEGYRRGRSPPLSDPEDCLIQSLYGDLLDRADSLEAALEVAKGLVRDCPEVSFFPARAVFALLERGFHERAQAFSQSLPTKSRLTRLWSDAAEDMQEPSLAASPYLQAWALLLRGESEAALPLGCRVFRGHSSLETSRLYWRASLGTPQAPSVQEELRVWLDQSQRQDLWLWSQLQTSPQTDQGK